MTEVDFRQGVREALDEEMARDDRVVLFGEDVGVAGGVFAVTAGLQERYGEGRVFDTPISELAIAGAGFGSAICGLRPVIEVMFSDFLWLAGDSLVNQAAKYWYLSGEQASVPLVVRATTGAGGRFGAIHSQVPIPWFQSVSGLKIACPATPGDAKGLLKAAIRDDNPVLFLEHKMLYGLKGPAGSEPTPLGQARLAREGGDLTLVSVMKGVHDCLAAADLLARDGIQAAVLDLRTVRPLDHKALVRAARQTGRVAVVEEGPHSGGWSAEVISALVEDALENLEDMWRLTPPDHPIPFSPRLEDAYLPGAEHIARSVRERMAVTRSNG